MMRTSREFRLPESGCPHCQKRLDGCFALPGSLDSPSVGDVTVCIGCGGFLILDQGLQVRALTEGELLQIMLSQPSVYDQLVKSRNAVLSVHADTRGGDRA